MTPVRASFVAAALLALFGAVAACSKDDAPASDLASGTAPPAASAPSIPPAPPGSAMESASASASPSPSASAPTPPPDPALASAAAPAPGPAPSQASGHTPAAPASAKAAADSAASGPACGNKPLPPCPLYAWMKQNTSPAITSEDFEGLAAALTKVVTFAPATAGYPNWASIARDGADAARAQSLDGVKASCRGCHTQYKDKYKREMRDRPI